MLKSFQIWPIGTPSVCITYPFDLSPLFFEDFEAYLALETAILWGVLVPFSGEWYLEPIKVI